MQPERLRRHAFVPSRYRDHGRRVCECGSLEGDAIHDLPEVVAAQREHDARVLGEKPDVD